jgi:hypothetical protein
MTLHLVQFGVYNQGWSLHTSSQGQKNLGQTLSIFGLQIGHSLQINARTLMSGY